MREKTFPVVRRLESMRSGSCALGGNKSPVIVNVCNHGSLWCWVNGCHPSSLTAALSCMIEQWRQRQSSAGPDQRRGPWFPPPGPGSGRRAQGAGCGWLANHSRGKSTTPIVRSRSPRHAPHLSTPTTLRRSGSVESDSPSLTGRLARRAAKRRPPQPRQRPA